MQATPNPLRRPKPARDRCVLHGRFYATDENGRLAHDVGKHVCLTAEELWITPELSIPLGQVEAVEIITRRGLPPRRFLAIQFVNPITGAREIVCICKPDPVGIGLYRLGPIQELASRIQELARRQASSRPVNVAVAGGVARQEAQLLDRCEVCGAKPAFYVSYVFLVSAVLLTYRSDAKRRIHCRKHNALHGFGYYLLTALTGWIGIGALTYPFVVFVAGRNLANSIGRAWIVLGVLPSIVLAVALVRWLA